MAGIMYFRGMVSPDFLKGCANSTKRRIVSNYSIPEKDIPALYDSSFYAALEVWNNSRIMGPVYSGGWAEWPADTVRIIKVLDMAFNTVQNEKAKEAHDAARKRVPRK